MDEGNIVTTGEQASAKVTRTWRENIPATSNPAGSDGVCIAQIGPVAAGQNWFVEFVRIKHTSVTLLPTLEVFKNGQNDLSSIDSDLNGQDNFETFPTPGCWLGEGEILIFVWSGCDSASVGKANSQVRKDG